MQKVCLKFPCLGFNLIKHKGRVKCSDRKHLRMQKKHGERKEYYINNSLRIPRFIFVYCCNVNLQTIAEIFLKLRYQFLWPVACGFQFTHEETQYRRFVVEFQSADQVTVFIQPGQTVFNILDLR